MIYVVTVSIDKNDYKVLDVNEYTLKELKSLVDNKEFNSDLFDLTNGFDSDNIVYNSYNSIVNYVHDQPIFPICRKGSVTKYAFNMECYDEDNDYELLKHVKQGVVSFNRNKIINSICT